MIHYIRTGEGAFKKKKVWDGVTSTLFNMPTTPLEADSETGDKRTTHIQAMYQDPLRDKPVGLNNGLFPLDIRRVFKVTGNSTPRPHDEICGAGEKLLRDPALYPEKEYRRMREDDAWWVTAAQKRARDAPPRQHPPRQEAFSSALVPLDEELWQQEVQRDASQDAQYFVTNLHGGTLIINGMEIKKGDVAGPLPEFAVIECPGGQVAFWWGVGGRNYRCGPEGVDFSLKWQHLRTWTGWEHVAMEAGQVWDLIIRDRQEREKDGGREEDDEQWARWKQTKESGMYLLLCE